MIRILYIDQQPDVFTLINLYGLMTVHRRQQRSGHRGHMPPQNCGFPSKRKEEKGKGN